MLLALCWASGLAGTAAVLQPLEPGDHVLCIDDLYGGTSRLMRSLGPKIGFTWDATTTADPERFASMMKPGGQTKLIWIETPTNPLLKVTDIAAVTAAVKRRNSTAIVVVDNTFQSAYFQRPLELGVCCLPPLLVITPGSPNALPHRNRTLASGLKP